MPVSLFGYVLRLKKFTSAYRKTHFGVQARNRWTLDETGFVTVTFT